MVASASTVNALPTLIKRVRSVSKLELERLQKTNVYRSLRQEWNNQRNEGRRLKKEREAAEKNWSQHLFKYSILLIFYFIFFLTRWILHWKIYDKNTSTKCIMHNSLNVIFSWLGLGQYLQHSLHGEDMFLLF